MATIPYPSDNHHHIQNGSPSDIAVVMVPLPAQGHLNQLLQLSRLITSYNIPVHYVSTPAHTREAMLRVQGWDPCATSNVHLHEFPIPEYTSLSLDPNAENKFPSHFMPLFGAAAELRGHVAELFRKLSQKVRRVIVIHDSLMASVVQDIGSVPNGESYIFQSVSAFCTFLYFWEGFGKPFEVDGVEEAPSMEDCLTQEFEEFFAGEMKHFGLSSGSLLNTTSLIEGKFVKLLEKLTENDNKPYWAIGPFNPIELNNRQSLKGPRHQCLTWLDEQDNTSVVFVSFGTTTSLPDEQIKELANGLEQSGLKFIWVLRDADRPDLNTKKSRKAQLPEGFEERINGRGLVVRDWAPQLEILAHVGVGGFLSHCGWNSCMESISMGVPLATWPMHSDQPRNAMLMTKVLGIGMVVKDWAKRKEIVLAETISSTLRKLIVSEEGKVIRRRAVELGGDVRRAVAEGGVTRMELDSFVAHLNRT